MESFDKGGEDKKIAVEMQALFDGTMDPAFREKLLTRLLERIDPISDEEHDRLMTLRGEELKAELKRLGVPELSEGTEESLLAGIEADLDDTFGPKS